MPAESWIVKIGGQTHREAVETEFAADNGCPLKIHSGHPSWRNQFDERPAMLGHDDTLTARRSGSSFGKAGFDFANRKFHGEFLTMLTSLAGSCDCLTREAFVVTW